MILLFKEQQNSTASKVTTLYLTFEELKTCSIEIVVPKHICMQHSKKKNSILHHPTKKNRQKLFSFHRQHLENSALSKR